MGLPNTCTAIPCAVLGLVCTQRALQRRQRWRQLGGPGTLVGIIKVDPECTSGRKQARHWDERARHSLRTTLLVPRSLKNPTLVRPPPVEAMMSFNTLTPHYEEDVIFALAAADTAKQLGLAGPDAHKASTGWYFML